MSARYRSVPCPKCGAKKGECCLRGSRVDERTFRFEPVAPCHRSRIAAWVDCRKSEGG